MGFVGRQDLLLLGFTSNKYNFDYPKKTTMFHTRASYPHTKNLIYENHIAPVKKNINPVKYLLYYYI